MADNEIVTTTDSDEAFLEVKNLCKYFTIDTSFFGKPTRFLKAVDGVSFKLQKGKTLGIVGESGCGKTTMGRTLLRLYDMTDGEVWFKGQKISALKNREFDKLRPNMQMIFQDPYASLSPRLTVGEIIGEAVKQHKIVPKKEYHDYVLSVMKMCGLQPHYFERYPHEFSGGQRQRICIARALALKPDLVICDEPVSALDVSIQAQIINMLIELRKTLGLTYVFISHDLSVVKHISDEVGVMYLGTMMEYGSKEAIFENTLHPYTRALFSAVPVPNPHVKMNRIILKGDIPSPANPPSGCKFHTRCEKCMEICGRIAPVYQEVEKGHFCACHLYNTEEVTRQLEENYEQEHRLAAEKAIKRSDRRFRPAFIDALKKDPAKARAVKEYSEYVEVMADKAVAEQLVEPIPEPVEAQPVEEVAVTEKKPAKKRASSKTAKSGASGSTAKKTTAKSGSKSTTAKSGTTTKKATAAKSATKSKSTAAKSTSKSIVKKSNADGGSNEEVKDVPKE